MNNVSTTRDTRRGELVQTIDRAELFAHALDQLADEIDQLAAPICAYGPIWEGVATRLRREALSCREQEHKARSRLVDIDAAEQAAARWVPTRSDR